MCVYCMIGDHTWKFDPPWPNRNPYPLYPPQVPQPVVPAQPPWSLERLKEYEELLKRVKALEDALGCLCEPNKADYLDLLRQRIDQLEKRVADR